MNFMQLKARWQRKLAAVCSDSGELLAFVCREMWPMKRQQHFADLMNMFEAIATGKHSGNFLHQLDILLAMSFLLCVVQCLHHQPTFMLLTFDYFGHNNLSSAVKITKAMMNVTTGYFFKHLFFEFGKYKHFPLLKRILLANDRKYVFGSKFSFWQCIFWSQAFYQVLLALLEMWMITSYIQFCVSLSLLPFRSLWLWPLAYVCMSSCFLLFSVTFILVYVNSIGASVVLYQVCVLFERLKFQSRRYLNYSINRLTVVRMLKYAQENTKSLIYTAEVSKTYGSLLLIYLWTTVPSNVAFISVLVFPNTCDLNTKFICFVIAFNELSGIIFIHWVASMVTSRIHKPYKAMYSQFVHYKTCNLSAHIKIANNIQTFLVKKAYGISYQLPHRIYGLMKMFAFLKFILLYGELMLYSYTMYLQSNSNRSHKS